MISVVLIDDEVPALKELQYLLSSYNNIHISGMYTNPIKALDAIEKSKPDVIFLDINMPYINGMEFVAKMKNSNIEAKIIFVTAYQEFAINAFAINAFDYILKPIDSVRFNKTMERLIEGYNIELSSSKSSGEISNIMIIDDSSIDRKIICKILKKRLENIKIFEEENGKNIANKLFKNNIHVCILDIIMPFKDGFQILKEIKEDQRIMDIPIIVCTGTDDSQAIEKALILGAYDYFSKPLSEEEMKVALPLKVKNAVKFIKRREELITYNDKLIHYNDELKESYDINQTMNLIKVQCFGRFQVLKNEEEIETIKWRTNKVRELFTYLLSRYEKSISKDDLMNLLFNNFEDKRALNNLYVTIYYLRRQLKEYGIRCDIILNNENYMLKIGKGICDYVDFDRFLSKHMIVDDSNIDEFEKIIEIYKGPYLDEEDYLWALEVRRYIEKKYEGLLLMIADYYERKSQNQNAEKTLKRLVLVNPLSEEGNKRLLEFYMNTKNFKRYTRQYKQYENLLKKEYNLTPDAKYQHFYYDIAKKV